MADPFWRIQRIARADGTPTKPVFWGFVHASSATVAIKKFLSLSRTEESPSHFTAATDARR